MPEFIKHRNKFVHIIKSIQGLNADAAQVEDGDLSQSFPQAALELVVSQALR